MTITNGLARWRRLLLQVLAVALIASVLVQVSADTAQATTSVRRGVPADFGVAVEQGDSFSFGSRVSSGNLSAVRAVALAAPAVDCSGGDENTRKSIGVSPERIREGTVSTPSMTGQPSQVLTPPGMRWRVQYCRTEVDIYEWRCPTDFDPCTKVYVRTDVSFAYYDAYQEHHPDAPDWIKTAVDEAWNGNANLDKVWWNASPGYNSRQIVGLPTWFAASQEEPGITDTVGTFEYGPYRGYGGPPEDPEEIWVEIELKPPRSEWYINYRGETMLLGCDTAGELWTETAAAAASSNTSHLCLLAWDETAKSGGGVKLAEMEKVQLIYPYELRTNAEVVIEVLGMELPSDGEVGTKELGDSRDMVVGEVQTHGVDLGGNAQPDEGAAKSPWVDSSEAFCTTAENWEILGWVAGPLCQFLQNAWSSSVAVLELVWDGAQFIGTVAVVVAGAVYDLIHGCLGIVADLAMDAAELVKHIGELVDDPSGKLQGVLESLGMIRDQLSNPETRLEFAQEVLTILGIDLLHLDLIAERDENGEWQIKEDAEWARWVGRLVCDVLVTFFSGGLSKLANSAQIASDIRKWLDSRIPSINPCAVEVLAIGSRVGSALRDAYAIALAAAQGSQPPDDPDEVNSFPAGTQVLMANGGHKAIEHIEHGDMVMSYNRASDIWEPRPVTDQWSAMDFGQIATLTLDDGSEVRATDGHLFFVASESEWVELEAVQPGAELLTPSGTARVSAVLESPVSATLVYELTVQGNHNFAVHTGTKNVLVHNRCAPNSSADNNDFTLDANGGVVYHHDPYGPFDNVAVDANGNPVVVKTGDFDVIVHTDGSITLVDKDGNIYVGGVLHPNGSVSVRNPDGTITVIDPEGHITTVPPTPRPVGLCNSFPTGTQVAMADGTHRAIEDIEPGDYVTSFDFDAEQWVSSRVSRQWSAIDHGAMATVTLDNGEAITATDHHRFWNDSDSTWTELVNLEPGNLLLTPDGVSPVVVDVVTSADTSTLVWELSVERTPNFAVQAGTVDVLVHNCSVVDVFDNDDGSTTTVIETADGDFIEITVSPDSVSMVEYIPFNSSTIRLETIETGNPPTITQHRGGPPPGITMVHTLDDDVRVYTNNTTGLTTTIFRDGTHSMSNTVIGGNSVPGEPNSLPSRPNGPGPTLGIAEVNGQRVELSSGAIGPAFHGDLTQNTPNNVNSTTHVEGHAAAIMQEQNIEIMELTINHQGGVCDQCASQVPDMLSDGQILIVHSPPDRTQYITSDGIFNVDPRE